MHSSLKGADLEAGRARRCWEQERGRVRDIEDLTMGSGSEAEEEVTDGQFGGRRVDLVIL